MPLATIPARGGPSGLKKGMARPNFQGSQAHAGKGKTGGKAFGAKRHRKIMKDTIRGITKPAIRRLARRGGVKRISGGIYDEVRTCIEQRLRQILHDCIAYTEYRNAKTVTVTDVIFSLKRIGQPIYGFDPHTN